MFAAHRFFTRSERPLRTKPTYNSSVSVKNQNNTQITLPTHTTDDIIFIWAGNFGGGVPTKPSSGGTVPNWIQLASGLGMHEAGLWYAVATSSSTTSGTWTAASGSMRLWSFTVRGGSTVGGSALSGSPWTQIATTTITCPSITMTNTRGNSLLIHAAIAYDYTANPTITQSNTYGYTFNTGTLINGSYFAAGLATKNVTTTDGSFTYGSVTNNSAGAYTGCDTLTVEIIP